MSVRGFSLVEVVIAVGIFAGSIVVILALLPSVLEQTAGSGDLAVAQRLVDAVRLELDRQVSADGFDATAVAVPIMGSPLEGGFALVATLDGLRLEPATGPGSGGIAQDDQRFLIEAWRFSHAPLSYDTSAAVLPLYIRVSWPYRIRGFGSPTLRSDRIEFGTTLVITR